MEQVKPQGAPCLEHSVHLRFRAANAEARRLSSGDTTFSNNHCQKAQLSNTSFSGRYYRVGGSTILTGLIFEHLSFSRCGLIARPWSLLLIASQRNSWKTMMSQSNWRSAWGKSEVFFQILCDWSPDRDEGRLIPREEKVRVLSKGEGGGWWAGHVVDSDDEDSDCAEQDQELHAAWFPANHVVALSERRSSPGLHARRQTRPPSPWERSALDSIPRKVIKCRKGY